MEPAPTSAGVAVKEHKKLKGLKTQNLRDHMSEAELIFTALAELSTRQIAETMAATGMKENKGCRKERGRHRPESAGGIFCHRGKRRFRINKVA